MGGRAGRKTTGESRDEAPRQPVPLAEREAARPRRAPGLWWRTRRRRRAAGCSCPSSGREVARDSPERPPRPPPSAPRPPPRASRLLPPSSRIPQPAPTCPMAALFFGWQSSSRRQTSVGGRSPGEGGEARTARALCAPAAGSPGTGRETRERSGRPAQPGGGGVILIPTGAPGSRVGGDSCNPPGS